MKWHMTPLRKFHKLPLDGPHDQQISFRLREVSQAFQTKNKINANTHMTCMFLKICHALLFFSCQYLVVVWISVYLLFKAGIFNSINGHYNIHTHCNFFLSIWTSSQHTQSKHFDYLLQEQTFQGSAL